jgi:hypothetical protein
MKLSAIILTALITASASKSVAGGALPGGACKPNAAGCCDFSGEWCNHQNGDGIMYIFTQPTGTCTVSGTVGHTVPQNECLVPHCYNGNVSGDTMSIVYQDKHTRINTTRTATLELATPQDVL